MLLLPFSLSPSLSLPSFLPSVPGRTDERTQITRVVVLAIKTVKSGHPSVTGRLTRPPLRRRRQKGTDQ